MIVRAPFLLLLLVSSLLFVSCDSDRVYKPQSFGEVHKIFVVSDDEVWESSVHDTLNTYYGTAYPILPHKEPIFDLVHYTTDQLKDKNERLKWRLLLFLVDLSDTESEVTKMTLKDLKGTNVLTEISEKGYAYKMGKNKWAHNQLAIYLIGKDTSAINDAITESFVGYYDAIKKFNIPKLNTSAYSQGYNIDAQASIKRKYNLNMKVPRAYKELPVDGLTWLRFETDFFYNDIIIQELDYEGPEQFTKEYIKSLSDTLGLRHISSFQDSSYMHVNDIDLPLYFETIQKENHYTAYVNGIWELVNDFKGGPFTAHLVKPQKGNKLYFVFGYIYAPSKEKRDYMANMQHVISSITFDK